MAGKKGCRGPSTKEEREEAVAFYLVCEDSFLTARTYNITEATFRRWLNEAGYRMPRPELQGIVKIQHEARLAQNKEKNHD